MPKIAITSDLHLGITDAARVRALATRMAEDAPDLTVLAGDLGEPLARFQQCLSLFAEMPGQVAVLAGNHDLWNHGFPSQALWEQHLPQATQAAGMLWLEGHTWRRDDIAVVGSIAWYDYSAVDPTLPPYPPEHFALAKRQFNNDGQYLDWPWTDVDFAQRCEKALCAQLQQAEADPSVRTVLVVTHVPIFEAQISRQPDQARWGFSNAYFGNLTIGRRVAVFTKVRAVISGHTHIGRAGVAPHLLQPTTLPPIAVRVLASDYHQPAYVLVDTDDWK